MAYFSMILVSRVCSNLPVGAADSTERSRAHVSHGLLPRTPLLGGFHWSVAWSTLTCWSHRGPRRTGHTYSLDLPPPVSPTLTTVSLHKWAIYAHAQSSVSPQQPKAATNRHPAQMAASHRGSLQWAGVHGRVLRTCKHFAWSGQHPFRSTALPGPKTAHDSLQHHGRHPVRTVRGLCQP